MNHFKSSILDNNLRGPGRVNNLKEIVLGTDHEFKGSADIAATPIERNYLLEYGSYSKPNNPKPDQTTEFKPTASAASDAPTSSSSTTTAQTALAGKGASTTTGPSPQPTSTNILSASKPAEPEILEIVTTTYADLRPEDFAAKPSTQNLEPPKTETDHSTPNRKRVNPLRNNSTIHEVPESEVSVEEELEYVTEKYEVGSRYEGYKKNGMRNGRGKFFYQDGGFYDGNWKDDKMHGEGKLYYNETKLAYEG